MGLIHAQLCIALASLSLGLPFSAWACCVWPAACMAPACSLAGFWAGVACTAAALFINQLWLFTRSPYQLLCLVTQGLNCLHSHLLCSHLLHSHLLCSWGAGEALHCSRALLACLHWLVAAAAANAGGTACRASLGAPISSNAHAAILCN